MHDSELFLERIEALSLELDKIKRGIIAVQNGEPWEEAFNEEVYLENADIKDKGYSLLVVLLEHVLKIKFSSGNTTRHHWIAEVIGFRDQLTKITLYDERRKKTNAINYLRNNMQDAYDDGIDKYKKAAEDSISLHNALPLIPEKCPWTFDNVMSLDIDELLDDRFFVKDEE